MTTSSSLSDASSTAEGLGKASRNPRMAFLIVGPPVVRLQRQWHKCSIAQEDFQPR